ncbi:choice-of-anchor Q domain-containing protein [Novipirellula rosea]|uniref:choice-of-anchor Q domain-containing protein n=1 Tax=Novipirellula rosea TaxID=1031540 RepID=UPI0031EF56B4
MNWPLQLLTIHKRRRRRRWSGHGVVTSFAWKTKWLRRLVHEPLESRDMLAVFAPSPIAVDGAADSLRAAIIQANQNSQNDTIELAAGVYRLSLENPNGQENAARSGDLDFSEINFTVTIQGQGIGKTIISQSVVDRVLQVMPGVNLVVNDLTIRGGIATDDGSDGVLPTSPRGQRVAIGGGLWVAGTLRVHRVAIEANEALGSDLDAGGGGLFAAPQSQIQLDHVDFAGNVSASSGGGLMTRSAEMFVQNSTFTGNIAARYGGAIRLTGNNDASLVATTFTSNSAVLGGGAIYNDGVTVAITAATIASNETDGDGGGIYNRFGALTIRQSTLAHNRAQSDGGGLFQFDATTRLINSTVSGNIAIGNGGGIRDVDSGSTLTHATVALNVAAQGGGLFSDGTSTATLNNSLVLGNGTDLVTASPTAGRNNLVGDPSSSGGLDPALQSENVLGRDDGFGGRVPLPFSTVLKPLDFYGGVTQTHALVNRVDNPAIGAARRSLAVDNFGNVITSDQRGSVFVREADAFGDADLDIGAYELQSLSTNRFVVTTLDDEWDADALVSDPLDLSLREAIDLANASIGIDRIEFDPSLTLGVIELSLGELVIRDDLELVGLGASRLSIDGKGDSRLFTIDDRDSARSIHVVIRDLQLIGGHARGTGVSGSGGAIWSAENLTLQRSHVTGNTADGLGGGVYSAARSQTVIQNSTIDHNQARFGGGLTLSNQSRIEQSTISGNHATADAGGLLQFTGTAEILQSTISGNLAGAHGGGIVSANAVTTLTHSIVAGNEATTGNELSALGGTFSGSFNLIGDPASAAGIDHGRDSNIVGRPSPQGRSVIPVQQILKPLAMNGGPTPTHALAPLSLAIDAGDPSLHAVAASDQRGSLYSRHVGGGVDIGAYERQTESDLVVIVTTADDQADPNPDDPANLEMSLREAIAVANATPGEFEVRFAPSVISPLQIRLGAIEIRDDVVFAGHGSELTIIDAAGTSRLFSIVNAGVRVHFQSVTLTGGNADLGGAIFASDAHIGLHDSVITGNTATNRGGAIVIGSGSLDLIRSKVSENHASGSAGGIAGNDVAVTLIESTVASNSSSRGEGFYVSRDEDVIRFESSPIGSTSTDDGLVIQMGTVLVLGTADDETFRLDLDPETLTDTIDLRFDGGGGRNSLQFLTSTTPASLLDDLYQTRNFEVIQLAEDAVSNLFIDADAVSRLSPQSESIQVGSFAGGNILLSQPTDWRMGSTRVRNGVFLRSLVNDRNPLPRVIEVGLPLPWQNLIRKTDANNDGLITAADALLVINELDSKTYSFEDGRLQNPLAVIDWPNRYFDVSGDGFVTAFDALQVINALARLERGPDLNIAITAATPWLDLFDLRRLVGGEEIVSAETPVATMPTKSAWQNAEAFAVRSPDPSVRIAVAEPHKTPETQSSLDSTLDAFFASTDGFDSL